MSCFYDQKIIAFVRKNFSEHLSTFVLMQPSTNIFADDGAFTPAMDKPEQALDIVREAISNAGYSFEDDILLAITLSTKDIYDQVSSV